jgi:hypothetical protein
MNPLRWVRWKVVAVLACGVAAVYFLGFDEIALSKVNTAGEESPAARWSIADMGLGLLAGSAEVSDLEVATPRRDTRDNVFGAAGAKLDLSMKEFLRGRYVAEEVSLQAPKLTVTRRKDGSINMEEIGGPPEEPPAPEGPPRDWVGTIRKWYERIQKVREKLPERSKEPQKDRGAVADYSRRATYPFEGRPSFAVRKIAGTGFEIAFTDEASSKPLPSLQNGTLEIYELTSGPSVQEEPTRFRIEGDIAGSKLSIGGTLDFRGERSLFQLDSASGDLPVSLIESFIGESLPVKLRSGAISLDAKVLLDGRDKLEVAPKLSLKKVTLDAREPGGKVAGMDASSFAQAFNEASTELDSIDFQDLRITGSLSSPRFEWGDTVKNLVASGGKAFAKKQAQKGLEMGKEALDKELGKSPLGESIKEQMKGIDTKSLPRLPGGLFGGGETKKPAEPEPKK